MVKLSQLDELLHGPVALFYSDHPILREDAEQLVVASIYVVDSILIIHLKDYMS